jgi:hypothetical protein
MGGSTKGERRGGRQKGTPNKRTKAREAAVRRVAKKIEAAIPGAFEGDSHALLMATYKNPKLKLAVRIDAAKAALPYEKARLSAVEPQRAHDDHVPLAERILAYRRRDAIEASAANVVELKQP